NARSQLPFPTGHPITFTGYNNGATVITGIDQGAGLLANAGILPPTVIATLKFIGTSAGDGQLSIVSPSNSPTASFWGLADDTILDPFIFAPPHAGFPMSFHVTAVPEPSSLALVGLAAVFGWRLRKRRG